jgi:cell division septation protein DedD
MFKLLSVITIFILTTLIAQPSYSDDVTINLDPTTPYVDVPFTVTEPVDATISTITGTPQTNPGFIDSWIELWQDLNKLRADDDGAHNASNVLASIITMPLTAGEYFIRATSFAWIASGATQFPTGSYLLSTNLTVNMPSPSPTLISPTPEPSPSPTESQTSSPTPVPSSSQTTDEPTPEPSSPSPSPSDTPSPSLTPEVPVGPVPEPNVPDPVVLLESSTPVPSPLPSVQDTLEVIVDSSPSSFPSSLPSFENVPEEIFATDETESVLEFLPEFSLEALQETFQEISETITAALSTVSNLGSEFTPEERKEAQQVVLGAIIVTQLSTSARRIK